MQENSTLGKKLKENYEDFAYLREREAELFNTEVPTLEDWQRVLLMGSNELLRNLDNQWKIRMENILALIHLQLPEIIEYWLDMVKQGEPLMREALIETFRLNESGTLENVHFGGTVAGDMIVVYMSANNKGKEIHKPIFIVGNLGVESVIFYMRDQHDPQSLKIYYQMDDNNVDFEGNEGSPAHIASIFSDFTNHFLTPADPIHSPQISTYTVEEMREEDASDVTLPLLKAWEILKRDNLLD